MTTARFSLLYPPEIQFGWGCREDQPAAIRRALPNRPSPKALLVTTRSLAADGQLRDLCQAADITICGEHSAVPHAPPLAG